MRIGIWREGWDMVVGLGDGNWSLVGCIYIHEWEGELAYFLEASIVFSDGYISKEQHSKEVYKRKSISFL